MPASGDYSRRNGDYSLQCGQGLTVHMSVSGQRHLSSRTKSY